MVGAGVVIGLGLGVVFSGYTKYELLEYTETLFKVFEQAVTIQVDAPEPRDVMEGGINGMLRTLDPYAEYIPERALDQLQFLTTGAYAGIGAMIQAAGEYTMVASVYEESPARQYGLQAGDTLVGIDGKSLKGLTPDQVSTRLKGKPGSWVRVQYRRPYVEGTQQVRIKRSNIHMPAVTLAKRIGEDVGYVHLSTFTSGCASKVRQSLTDLETSGGPLRGIVLDLRDNVGGLLDEAVRLVGLFVEAGQVVVEVKGRGMQAPQTFRTEGNAPFAKQPLVILVNRLSASSSEVTAGALQDLDRAVIVGERTYGKGLVQTTCPLPLGSVVKLTTGKYYTPSGRCIQALDYAHRDESGAVGKIPDSLVSAFQTSTGRTVYDGGGVSPDVVAKSESYPVYVSLLYVRNAFFRYATQYRHQHAEIAPVADFRVDSLTLAGFEQFLSAEGYIAQMPIMGMLDQVDEMARHEKQDAVVVPHLDSIRTTLQSAFSGYYWSLREPMARLLEEEIVSRYYYQKGRAEKSLEYDQQVKESLELLRDTSRMRHILQEVSPPDGRSISARDSVGSAPQPGSSKL